MEGITSAVIRGPLPPEVESLIERRRRLGIDVYDEVWHGVYHMAAAEATSVEHGRAQVAVLKLLTDHEASHPTQWTCASFNLGDNERDFRVPDGGLVASGEDRLWVPRALLVVEVLSRGDETFQKFDFYAQRVAEVLVVDPGGPQPVRCFRSDGRALHEGDRSEVLLMRCSEIALSLGGS